MKKFLVSVGTGLVVTVALTGTAAAHHCNNISKDAKNPGAGAQVVINPITDEVTSAGKGVEMRLEKGLITEDGDGYHGIVGLDFNNDGVADVSTFQVTPTDVLPDPAMENGSEDHGIVSF